MKWFFLIFLTCHAVRGNASGVHTIQDILQYASHHAPDIAILANQLSAGKAEIEVWRSSVYPTVSARSDVNYFSTSASGLGFVGSQFSIDRIKGVEPSWRTDIGIRDYNFIQFIPLLRYLKIHRSVIALQSDIQRDAVFMDIIRLFKNAMIAADQVRVSKKLLDHAQKLKTYAEIEALKGGISEIDVTRTKATFAMREAEVTSHTAIQESAVDQLKVKIGWPQSQPLHLTWGDLEAIVPVTPAPKTAPKTVQLKSIEIEQFEQEIGIKKTNFLPTVTVEGFVSSSYIDFQGGDFEEPRVGDLFDTPNLNYGARVSLTALLFNGFRRRYELAQTKALARIARLEKEKLKAESRINLSTSSKSIRSAYQMVKAAQTTEKVMARVMAQTQKDFKDGRLSLSELLKAEAEWLTTNEQLSQAKATLLLAVADYKMASGQSIDTLSANPLPTTSAKGTDQKKDEPK